MKRTGKLIALLAVIVSMTAIICITAMQSSAATAISGATISSIATQVYTGEAIKPAVTVSYGSVTLKENTDYSVSYANNTDIGVATLTVSGRGAYTGTKTVKFCIVCPTVTNLSIKWVRQTSAYLTFTGVEQADGYQVWVYNNDSGHYELFRSITLNELTVKDLTAGSTTYVRVRPYNKVSTGGYVYGALCSSVCVKTICANVTGLTQTASTDSSVSFTWDKMDGASGYYVFTSDTKDGTYTKYTLCLGNKLTIGKLNPASSLYVAVRSYRDIDGVIRNANMCEPVEMLTMPSETVKNFKSTKTTYCSATLSWDALEGASGYAIYLLKDGAWTLYSLTTDTTKTINSLSSCTEYTYKVCPYIMTAGGKRIIGEATEPLTVATVPRTVTNLKAESATNETITITWTASAGANGYQLWMLDNATGAYKRYTNSSGTRIPVTKLTHSTQYKFLVRGFYLTSAGSYVFGEYKSLTTSTDDLKVDSIKVSTTATATPWTGEKVTFSASVLPSYAENKNVIWSSSNKNVATINASTGIATAVAGGSTVITATAADGSGTKGTYTLKVFQHASGVKISSSTMTLAVGENTAMCYEVLPSTASVKGVTFSSSNSAVVKINAYGYVTAVSAGTAVITITSKDTTKVSAKCTVTVKKASVTAITLPSTLTIYVGQTYTVNPTFTPANATNKGFKISIASKSSLLTSYPASSYIKISGTTIKGVKDTSKPGAFTMTVTSSDGSKTATCKVTVITAASRTPVTGVSITTSTSSWYPGRQARLTASVIPSGATDKTVQWTSSNTNVATVDANGYIICVNTGTTTITAKTTDGGKTATYSLTVVPLVSATGISVSPGSVDSLMVGGKVTLKATVSPSNATNKELDWTTNNAKVATVSSAGVVSGVSEGTATITATSKDGKYKAVCTVNVRPKGVFISPKTYYGGCTLNQTIQLSASVVTEASNKNVRWSSSNPGIATVTADGLVTIVGYGSTHITATSVGEPSLFSSAIVSTETFTLPSLATGSAMYSKIMTALNNAKISDRPGYTLVNAVEFVEAELATPSNYIDNDSFNDLFADYAESETIIQNPITDIAAESTSYARYISYLPLKGRTQAVIAGLPEDAFNLSKSSVTDMGDTTYCIKLVFNKEVLTQLPSKYKTDANGNNQYNDTATRHGRVFDILYKEYMDSVFDQLNSIDTGADLGIDLSMQITTGDIKSTYHDCSVTVYLDKITNQVVNAVYDMNVLVNVSKLKMQCKIGILPIEVINSDVKLDVNSYTDIHFSYPTWRM